MPINILHSLETKELLSILRHVQLGDNHLSKILYDKEYRNLLELGKLSNNQISQMVSDSQEKIGNVSVIVNTILTSFFGGWLGFNAFNNCTLPFIVGFIIILSAVSFGSIIGYLGYTFTHHQAKLAIKKQRLFNVQQLIIDILSNKFKNRIEAVQTKVNLILYNLKLVNKEPDEFQIAQHELLKILLRLKPSSAQKDITVIYNKIVKKIKTTILKLNEIQPTKKIVIESDYHEGDFLLNNALTNASYIKTLTKINITDKHQIPKLKKWLLKNTPSILVGLIPTFLGTFASMFVFLNGFPAFFGGLNIYFGFSLHVVLLLKKLALIFAFCVSLYFAYSHIHSNYKAFRRAKQLEGSEKMISEKNNSMIKLMAQQNYWLRIYNYLTLLEDIHFHFSVENQKTHTHALSESIS